MEKKLTTSFSENEYSELLQQSVAVLEEAKLNIARSIAANVNKAHWEIGKLLHERKLDSKHGSGVVLRLSDDLKQRFPDPGCFTSAIMGHEEDVSPFLSVRYKTATGCRSFALGACPNTHANIPRG